MTDAIVPIRAVRTPTDPNSSSALLRFYTELRERTGGDVDLLTLVDKRVQALMYATATPPASVRKARTVADSAQAQANLNTARVKELMFLTY